MQKKSQLKVENIICAQYDWIDIPTIFSAEGVPLHQREVTNMNGLYFLGLPWQFHRGSALLLGVGEDAKFLSQYIIQKLADLNKSFSNNSWK